MAKKGRVVVLIIIALVGGLLTINFVNAQISSIPDYAAKATILAATITVLGVIFSAMYNEISSYYKDRSIIDDKNISERSEMAWQTAKKYLERLHEIGIVDVGRYGTSVYWWIKTS